MKIKLKQLKSTDTILEVDVLENNKIILTKEFKVDANLHISNIRNVMEQEFIKFKENEEKQDKLQKIIDDVKSKIGKEI